MKKSKKKLPRNGSALAAKSRKAGISPMKHRLEPKKGAKNDQSDLLNQTIDEDEIIGCLPTHCMNGKTCCPETFVEMFCNCKCLGCAQEAANAKQLPTPSPIGDERDLALDSDDDD
jgi:hypothetical protein